MTDRIYWRCFHCGDTFTRAQERWAREHFGRGGDAEPVCLIRTPGEGGLLTALRKAEEELASWRSDTMPAITAMDAMRADYERLLRAAEERGYNKGLQDAKEELT